MGEAATNLDEGDTSGVLRALQSAGEILKIVLKHFYDNLTDEKISHQFWLAYVQGFHAWALGNVNGVSGGHAMVIRSLDGFLGIRPWPTSEIEALHLPLAQRNWLNSLRDYDIRSQAKSEPKVIEALDSLVRQLRVASYLYSHSARVIDPQL
jgi:hypothetical protein